MRSVQLETGPNKAERLPRNVRRILGPYFPELDLSKVRVYCRIPWVVRRAARVAPVAITIGRKIYFSHRGHSGYDPETVEGLELIAHELTHTVQYARFRTRAGFWLAYWNEFDRNRTRGMSLAAAYENISFEIEARQRSAEIMDQLIAEAFNRQTTGV